jgi:putative acetyltransferase
MKGLTIRRATNRDTKMIVSMVKEILGEFGLTYSPEYSESDLNNIEATYLSSGGLFEVIETESGQIIGTVGLYPLSETSIKLRKMYVKAEFRKLGLGKILLQRATNFASRKGYRELVLETVNSMKAAIALYERSGFKRVENQAAASPRCDIVMVKDLKTKDNRVDAR